MSTEAPWWGSPESGDQRVVRHAPDADNYHVPDADMLAKMRGSLVGRFAVIPQANRDGTSKGFDMHRAGPVHVDPGAPDGGVIFDPGSVDAAAVRQAVNNSEYPHEAFYQLGTPARLLGYGRGGAYYGAAAERADLPRENPHVPSGAYIVPKAAEDGGQVPGQSPLFAAQEEQALNPVPPLAPAPPPPAPYQQPAPYLPPQPYPYTQPPPLDPNMAALMSAVVGMQQQMQALLQRAPPQPPTTGVSPNPLPQGPPPLATVPVEGRRYLPPPDPEWDQDHAARPIRQRVRRENGEIVEKDVEAPRRRSLVEQDQPRQTVDEYRRARDGDARSGVIAGFETLELDYVNGPVPVKARRQVFFEIPGAGKHAARYHGVITSAHCVALVYDTRYEDGTQYLPPDLGEAQIKLHVPHLKKTFVVSSMGFQYAHGVFDHVVLILHSEEDLDYEHRQE